MFQFPFKVSEQLQTSTPEEAEEYWRPIIKVFETYGIFPKFELERDIRKKKWISCLTWYNVEIVY